MAELGQRWPAMQAMECSLCQAERDRRNRVMDGDDPRVRREPCLPAPFIHKNNEQKYHAMLLRAREQAKMQRIHVLWFCIVDTPQNPAQIVKTPARLKQRLQRFLQLHDQQTAGIPGLNVLYEGMQAKVIEKLVENKQIVILKHSPCTVIGWTLHPADAASAPGAERCLSPLHLLEIPRGHVDGGHTPQSRSLAALSRPPLLGAQRSAGIEDQAPRLHDAPR